MADIPISKMVVPGSNDTLLLRDSSAANKVQNPTSGNLASLDGNGNLADSGWKSDKTTTAVSGNPISISGLKSNQLAINPIITLEPIQAGSGDPSPVNERLISGYDKIEVLSCGKNLFDESKLITGYFNDFGWSTAEAGWRGIAINANPGDKITVSGIVAEVGVFVVALKDAKDCSSGYYILDNSIWVNNTFTIPSEYHGIWIPMTNASDKSAVQIEYGETATTFEPYHKTTALSLVLGQTVYGATYYPRTGELRVTRGIVDLGDLEWQRQYEPEAGVYRFFTTSTIDDIGGTLTEYGNYENVICSIYENHINTDTLVDNICFVYSNKYLYVYDSRYTDATLFKTAMVGQKLVYELATPYTIQLTPHEISLLKDYAYVSTNGTNISFSYHNGELASLGDVAQLGQTVNELGRYVNIKTNKTVIPYTAQSFTSSTSLDYTGVSITIPANSSYFLGVSLMYINSIPQQIAIATSSTDLLSYTTIVNNDYGYGCICGRTGPSALTIYIWAKYNGVSANGLDYGGWYES